MKESFYRLNCSSQQASRHGRPGYAKHQRSAGEGVNNNNHHRHHHNHNNGNGNGRLSWPQIRIAYQLGGGRCENQQQFDQQQQGNRSRIGSTRSSLPREEASVMERANQIVMYVTIELLGSQGRKLLKILGLELCCVGYTPPTP